MARPRLGESESKRLQMVITEEELRSIEDWQFANRVPSKSEAIRRLCQIGLLADEELEPVVDYAFQAFHRLEEDHRYLHDQMMDMVGPRAKRKTFKREEVTEVLHDALVRVGDSMDAAEVLYTMIVALFNGIVPFGDANTIREGEKSSREAIARANKRLDEIAKREEIYAENQRLAKVWASMTPEDVVAYQELSDEDQEELLSEKMAKLKELEDEQSNRGD